MLHTLVEIDFPHVIQVRHVDGHTLWLRFNDGVEGHVDFTDWAGGPAFQPMRDWAGIAPEALYERLTVTGSVAKRAYAQLFDDAMRQEAAKCAAMPEVSRFFGMVIHMFWTEHEAPHFHARYGEYVASIDIRTGAVTTRRFPGRALRLLDEWRVARETELLENWDRMRRGEQPLPIAPLE